MGMNGGAGPDMAKMLQMMMPYMDPSTKRTMSIMMKLQELRDLMGPPKGQGEKKTAQPQKEHEGSKEEQTPWQAAETADFHRPMGDTGKGEQQNDLAAALQEGLTPEQRNMITSLTGMLK